jgi:hypothetical protein
MSVVVDGRLWVVFEDEVPEACEEVFGWVWKRF